MSFKKPVKEHVSCLTDLQCPDIFAGVCSLPLVSRVGNVGITLWSLWRKPLRDCRFACYEKLSFNSGFERIQRAVKYEYDSGLCVDRWLKNHELA